MQAGRAEELYLNPADLFVAGFFSELNLFEARVRGGVADTPVGKVAATGIADGASVDGSRPAGGFRRQRGGRAKSEARILSRRYLGVVELLEFAVSGPKHRCGRVHTLRRFVSRCARYLAFLAQV